MKIAVNLDKLKAIELISKYPQDVIDHINEYRFLASTVKCYEFEGMDLVEVDNSDEVEDIRRQYLISALHEGAFETEDEFDELANALDVVDPIGDDV